MKGKIRDTLTTENARIDFDEAVAREAMVTSTQYGKNIAKFYDFVLKYGANQDPLAVDVEALNDESVTPKQDNSNAN